MTPDLRSADWTLQPFLSHEQIAEFFGLHRSRVQQIEKEAIGKLRTAIEREAAAGKTVAEWLGECA